MRIYSDFPARRAVQLLSDASAVIVISLGIWLGVAVGAAIAALAEIAVQLQFAGRGFERAMLDAGAALGGIPVVGDSARAPFDTASHTGGAIVNIGTSAERFIATAATIVGVAIAIAIIAVVLSSWLPRRLRFISRATEARRLARLSEGHDLLALRALAGARAEDLAAIGRHPVQAWRTGEPDVVRRLAELELRAAGVRLVVGSHR